MNFQNIEASGDNTLINIEIDGAWRSVSLSREAIEDNLPLSPEVLMKMSSNQRCDFVRSNLTHILAAAKQKIEGREDAPRIWLDAGDL